ncbi:MAG: Holliday junction resolvase RecU [Bacilli bacterium]|jgi:recombination protein U|nr:Holliday junction resolvase RecU [Bacilli bacterium]MDD3389133.1 Holliday junction resolvase RecU [Bacilli bacterium]MDD4344777.1 Holliday junction resolvase RecU [Bacilli bacterium]MDD4520899.1 Holliday junction resolvase RecU [Bacilli bacterium]MDY0399584.1 Holliday junction resolvase RecU [Bacilli bacterium]
MINYPNGKAPLSIKTKKATALKGGLANRGMNFEAAINRANAYYVAENRAIITKRPTPIRIVKVDYSHGAHITDAYFEKQSTADYNGVYRGKYLDFETKSTQAKTSFPLANITAHQIAHLSGVIEHGGIAFFLIDFAVRQEIFLLDASFVIECYRFSNRRSITYQTIKEKGFLVPEKINPAIDYLAIVDQVYF